MRAVQGLSGVSPVALGIKGVIWGVKFMYLSSLPVCATPIFWVQALELSTLLEVTEAVTMYVRASCP